MGANCREALRMRTIVPLSNFEGKSRSIIRYADLEMGGSRSPSATGGSGVQTKVALLDPKHIVVRTILTYDEVDLLSYPFGGQLSRNHRVADPSSFVKLSWHDEIYHLVQFWHIKGGGSGSPSVTGGGAHRMAETVTEPSTWR